VGEEDGGSEAVVHPLRYHFCIFCSLNFFSFFFLSCSHSSGGKHVAESGCHFLGRFVSSPPSAIVLLEVWKRRLGKFEDSRCAQIGEENDQNQVKVVE
jgi:hypothetical protein